MERFLTPKEIAARLVVRRRTVEAWLRTGRLKGIKVGNLWRIKEEDLMTFLSSRCMDKRSAPMQKE